MKRVLAGLCTAAAIAVPAAPAGTAQDVSHTSVSTRGSAGLVNTEGCRKTEIHVSSSVAMHAGQPGAVDKEGFTAVFLRVTDICADPSGDAAAAVGGGTVLFEADGRNLEPLVADPRLTAASVTTDLPGTDRDGNPVTISLAAAWTGTGPLFHETSEVHLDYPGEGTVSITDGITRMGASAHVAIMVNTLAASGTDEGAILQQMESSCAEMPRPGVGDFHPCFGFPG